MKLFLIVLVCILILIPSFSYGDNNNNNNNNNNNGMDRKSGDGLTSTTSTTTNTIERDINGNKHRNDHEDGHHHHNDDEDEENEIHHHDDEHAYYVIAFTQWTHQYNKIYPHDEFMHRFRVFKKNLKFIDKSNKKNSLKTDGGDDSSLVLGLNQFSDITHDEFKSTFLSNFIPFNETLFNNNTTTSNTTTTTKGDQLKGSNSTNTKLLKAVTSIDWRVWGAVQVVKNQGSCGSCYAFSAMASLETAYWRKYESLPNLSEQHVVDCTEYGNQGCSGGWMHEAFRWIKDKGGVSNQANYPYTASKGTCRHDSVQKAANVASHNMLRNEQDILNVVSSLGTVSVAINADTQAFAYYQSGILDIPNCGTNPTHAVTVIGYGSTNGVDYWLLKNSYGTSWGEKGYFRLRRGTNQCGIANYASYPVAV